MDVVPHGGEPNSERQAQDVVNQAVPRAPESELLDELSLHLFDAVRDRDQAAVRLLVDGGLLDGGANLSANNIERQTPLHLAVKNDDVSMVQLLLERGADPDATAANGNKPLYDAAESGYLNIVGLLLEFSANVEAFNIDQQRTALYQAVENGHNAVAKILSGVGPTRSFTLTTARRWKTLPRARLPSLPCYDLVK
jgi:Ankyrin repeats (3 copies)